MIYDFQCLIVYFDRFVALSFPLFHYKIAKSANPPLWKTSLVCVGVWILAIFLAHTRRFTGEWMKCDIMVIMTVLRSILPLTITAVLNILIFVTIHQNTIRRMKRMQKDEESEKKLLLNKKAATTIFLLMLCIFMSYVPLRVVTMISVCGYYPGLYERLSNYVVILKYVNSIMNPFIYMIRTPMFRGSIVKFKRKISINFST